MAKPRKTKAERAIVMIARGATTAAIVKALNVSPQYVYNVRSRMNKESKAAENSGTVITPPFNPAQQQLDLHPATNVGAITLAEPMGSIQGEYSKQREASTWHKFKTLLGF